YDEPEILRSSSYQICLTGAEAGHDQEPRASLRDIMFDKLLGGRQSAKVRQCFKPVPTCLTSFLLGVPILSPFFVRLIPFVAGTIDQWRQVRVPGAPVAIRRAGKSDGCIGPSSPDDRGDGASHRGVPLAGLAALLQEGKQLGVIPRQIKAKAAL